MRDAFYNIASPGWFEALGVPIVEGRDFAPADSIGAPNVAVVNRRLARQLFAGESAIGRRIRFGARMAEVIGVASDTTLGFMHEDRQSLVVLSLQQVPASSTRILIRTAGDPGPVAPAVRRTVAALDPALAMNGPMPLVQAAGFSLAPGQSAAARALGTFGALSLFLALAGLYALVSYGVSRRTRESAFGWHSVRTGRT